MKSEIVVVPTYNEKDTIDRHLSTLVKLYPEVGILVVDDNSPDGTADLVTNFQKKYPQVMLMSRMSKTGLGDAYKAALLKLKNDPRVNAIFTMDADGSHDPIYLAKMREALSSNETDLVIGSRYVDQGGVSNWDLKRRFLSKMGNIYSRFLLNIPINDLTAGLVGFKKSMLDKVDIASIASDGYAYQIEFKYRMFRAGAKVKEIPIVFTERFAGRSKMNYKIIIEGLFIPFKIFLRRIISPNRI